MERCNPDVLELLLPDAPPAVHERARRITTALRLLATDARSKSTVARRDAVGRAAEELDRGTRMRTVAAIESLLTHYLSAALTADTFTWFGEPALRYQDAWDQLAGLRETRPRLAGVPGPGESPVSVARRLLRCGERAGMGVASRGIWNARVVRVEHGARAGEAGFRALLETGGTSFGVGGSRHTDTVTEVAACLFDRGDVRAARDWLAEKVPARAGKPRPFELRAARLSSWCRLLLFECASTDVPVSGGGSVPTPLRELREARPDWLPWLAGPPARGRSLATCGQRVRDRAELGAVVFAVFEFQAGSRVTLLLDAAPGVRADVRGWLGRRDGSWTVPGEPEHELLLTARTVRVQVETQESAAPRGALAGGTRALALVPILGDDGEVAGWVHAEWEHALVPGSERLLDVARAWRNAVLHSPPDDPVVARGLSASPLGEQAPCGHAIERLVTGLGIKTSHRRWFAYAVEGEGLVRVADGGEGLPWDNAGCPGGEARTLTRARATGGTVTFAESDPRLSVHASAASGLAVPLCVGGRVVGVFALESSRRRDFRPADVARVARAVDDAALAFRLGQFRVWYRARFTSDVMFDTTCPQFASFAARLFAAARSRTPVVLSGPAGVGKLALARWLHFESRVRENEFQVERCARTMGAFVLEQRPADRGPGTILLDGLDRLDGHAHERLLDLLDGRADTGGAASGPVRILATTRRRLAELADAGTLGIGLSRRLERLELFVPPLCDRRMDIPMLARFLARRIATEEAVSAPEFTDDAEALLWRQDWPGNVRELENAVFKLVLHHAGEELDAEAIVRALLPYGVQLARRLPSRHPRRADLTAALATTRTRGGRPNKSRAAQYLGWDPDTLVARMKEAHIDGEELVAANGWSGEFAALGAPDPPA